MARAVVLLTDFGAGSSYVGEVKGVLAGLAPGAPVLDLCHDVRPQQVAEGAFLLGAAWRRFPRRSVFVAVVDPGVGGEREILCLETLAATFLAPDNGLLSRVWAELVKRETSDAPAAVKRETNYRLYAVTNRRLFLPEVSCTFHGRDIFAPVAARLAQGWPVDLLGPRRDLPILLPLSRPQMTARGLRCHVLYVDRYGNLITDATGADLPAGALTVEAAGRAIAGLSASYAGAEGLLALVDSWGHLEIALRDGNAAAALGLGPGDEVFVR
ncbi:MAG: SAM hydrolase/SAM-dependent halogenase family protein [Chloroflexota bacterium]